MQLQQQQWTSRPEYQAGLVPSWPSQLSTTPEPSLSLNQPPMLPSQMIQSVSQVSSTQYPSSYDSPPLSVYLQQQQRPHQQHQRRQEQQQSQQHLQYVTQGTTRSLRSKRRRLNDYSYAPSSVQQGNVYTAPAQDPFAFHDHPSRPASNPRAPRVSPGAAYAASGASATSTEASTRHHHHRMPKRSVPADFQSKSTTPAPEQERGPFSVVGEPGMPKPAPRPKGPKLKFTPEDDALLIELKETKDLTWKQIADFFPGRSPGTLQVRYCTKLKAKATVWNDEMTQRLRNAMQDYDRNRWRWVATKVGSGISPAACKDRAEELEAEEMILQSHQDQESRGEEDELKHEESVDRTDTGD